MPDKDLRRESDAPVFEISGKMPYCHIKQCHKFLSTIDLILGQAPRVESERPGTVCIARQLPFQDATLPRPTRRMGRVFGPVAVPSRAGDQRTVGADGQPSHPAIVRAPAKSRVSRIHVPEHHGVVVGGGGKPGQPGMENQTMHAELAADQTPLLSTPFELIKASQIDIRSRRQAPSVGTERQRLHGRWPWYRCEQPPVGSVPDPGHRVVARCRDQ